MLKSWLFGPLLASVVMQLQCYYEGLVDCPHLLGREFAEEVSHHRLWQADNFITMNAAVMFQSFIRTNGHLCGEAFVGSVDWRADNGRES